MKTLAWKDLKHKSSPERIEEIDREALAELDRMGFGALRKARQQTQVEVAEKLGIDQASVSAIENRSDLLLSTLAKYVRALGGDVEIRAVFPEATFNLEPLLTGGVSMHKPEFGGKRRVVAESAAAAARRRAAAAGGR
jgi:transcriptional regulator with XRE-family HTH domain